MPPKEEKAGGTPLILKGFDPKEQRLLAAAFLATAADGKIDYAIMEELTGHTQGTLKKFWPPVKRRAAELYPSFAKAQGLVPEASDSSKPPAGKKRKAAESDPEENGDQDELTNGEEKKAGKAAGKTATKKPAKKGKKTKAKKEADVKEEEDGEEE